MTSGATINSGTGTITLSADEDIALGALTTTNPTSTAVTVTSDSGSIMQAGEFLSITGGSSFSVGDNQNITLDASSNVFTGTGDFYDWF